MEAMTMKEYRESQKRAGQLQKLFKTNPEEAKRITTESWKPFVDKVNKYRQSLNK